MASVVLTFSNITNNGKPCKDPIIYITGAENVAFPCGDKVDSNGEIKLTVPDSVFGERQCISGVIKCAECDSCKEEAFNICLCDALNPCEACQECVGGICIDKCPDKKCVNGACCDCEVSTDCGNGYICNGCNCVCPTGYKNSQGDCVECLTNQQCGPCEECINGNCVSKCADGLICDGKNCTCPPGTEWDTLTRTCVPVKCTTDAQCKECEVCVGGECVPVKCPPGTKCVNGECIPWPCDKPCQTGADCGEGCGCLDGQCIPCELLDCTDESSPAFGRCVEVSGCRCNGNKCEGVDNCDEYCDEFSPCETQGCTCYNNRCVSCENFSCEDSVGGCASYTGCECDSAGNCVGSEGCTDTLTITKEEDCSKDDGCALVATLATKGCKCDSIKFKTKNTTTCSQNNSYSLKLDVSLFKGNAAYANYANEITIGDNEFVTGIIKTVVTHYDANNNILSPQVSAVPDTNINNNTVAAINVTDDVHFKKTFTGPNGTFGTRVVFELRAQSITIPNNGCIKYDNVTIATYELNFQNDQNKVATCAKLGGEYAAFVEAFANDKVSSKKPLFIWSRGTENFGSGKFDLNTKTYKKGGWFKKVFGTQISGGWVSKITSAVSNGVYELISNYNYQVKVSCGCSTTAVHDKAIFCCPTEFNPVVKNCGKVLEIPPFNTCSPNKNLNSLNGTLWNKAGSEEIQTYYKVFINGTEHEAFLNPNGGNLQTTFTYTHNKEIKDIIIKQVYKGTPAPLVPEACEYKKFFTNDLAEFDKTVKCGEIVIKSKANNPAVSAVTGKDANGGDVPFSKVGNDFIATGSKVFGKITVTVSFLNSTCQVVEEYDIPCDTERKAVLDKTGVVFAPCSTSDLEKCGKNVKVRVTGLLGFTANCEIQDPKDQNKWNKPVTGSNPPYIEYDLEPFTTFIGRVREVINGTTVVAETLPVEIKPPTFYDVEVVPSCQNAKGKIIVKAITCQFKQQGTAITTIPTSFPKDMVIKIVSSPYNYQQEISTTSFADSKTEHVFEIPEGYNGVFSVEVLKAPTNTNTNLCVFAKNVDVTSAAINLGTTIYTDKDTYCVNNKILFRVSTTDGIVRQYRIDVTGGALLNSNGGTASSNIVSSAQSGFPLSIKPNSNNSTGSVIIQASVVSEGCFTNGTGQKTVSVLDALTLISWTSECTTGSNIKFTVFTSGNPAVRAINSDGDANFSETSLGSNVWTLITEDPGFGRLLQITLNPGTSCAETFDLGYRGCRGGSCPEGQTVDIIATPQVPTCSVGQNVTISFLSTSLGPVDGEEYAWYEVVGGFDSLVPTSSLTSGTNPGIIGTNNTIPPIQVGSSPSPRSYKLVITTNSGDCPFSSEEIVVVSGGEVPANIVGPGIAPDTTVISPTSSYSYTAPFYQSALYTWTLVRPSGTIQLGFGLELNSIIVNSFEVGSNILQLTIVKGECTGTAQYPINVPLICDADATIGLVDPANPTCSKLSGGASEISGSAITSYEWRINGNPSSQSGTSPIAQFNTSEVVAGDTVNITLYVEFANGCNVTSAPFSYTRCACICDVGVCKSQLENQGINGAINEKIVTVPSGDVYIKFEIGGFPDRLIVRDSNNSGAVYVDTYQVGTNSSLNAYPVKKIDSDGNLVGTEAYQTFDLNSANADPSQTAIAINDSIVNLRTKTGTSCLTLASAPTPNDPSFTPFVETGIFAKRGTPISGNEVIYIKIPQSELLSNNLYVKGIPFQLENCSGSFTGTNQASFEISCTPFPGSGVTF